MRDPDTEHYLHQEAAHLRSQGWAVIPPEQRARPDSLPCPGERCLTVTPGGRLCAYCRRSKELA